MRTCCSTKSRCPELYRVRQRARAAAAAALSLAALAAFVVGCSDDVVCSDDTTPYVVAHVEEVGGGRSGSTDVEVYRSEEHTSELQSQQ